MFSADQGVTPGDRVYVDDVFSTYIYTDNTSPITIVNGVDLAGDGGMVWIKCRNNAVAHGIYDTVRGVNQYLDTSSTAASVNLVDTLTQFNSDGFNIGEEQEVNGFSGAGLYASWTFRKAPKFFDVVTYSGNDSLQTINHSLGIVPGMIIIKPTNTTGNWHVYHTSLGTSSRIYLNDTSASVASGGVDQLGASSFRVSNTGSSSAGSPPTNVNNPNKSGVTYVAYLFAHDTSDNGVIQCGSFTTDASGNATVELGWEPQFLLVKSSGAVADWVLLDETRGWNVTGSDSRLRPNVADGEAKTALGNPTSTGFFYDSASSIPYIYLAIRRSNKPPTSGSQVFQPTVYTGTNTDYRLVNTGIKTDMAWVRERNTTIVSGVPVIDRMRDNTYLLTNTTATEVGYFDLAMSPDATGSGSPFASMVGFGVGNNQTTGVRFNANTATNDHIALAFKRAAGFFDIVCYTGANSGAASTYNHNLGAVPALMIIKSRATSATSWTVYYGDNTDYVSVNASNATADDATRWNDTSPTSTAFTVGSSTQVNGAADYVAYLFGSMPGISSVGTYTGNGSNQIIDCGFSTGARFILIKRLDSTGNWFFWDSARGIVAGNDPYIRVNGLAAEVTTDDSIDPDSAGFVVNQTALNINVSSATYLYFAIA